MTSPTTVRLVGLLVIVGMAAGCGEGLHEPPEFTGTYVLDRAATRAALLASAAALDDERVTARMVLPEDPDDRARLLRAKQALWRLQAERAMHGMLDHELTICPDGTWHGQDDRRGSGSVPIRGTRILQGSELSILPTYPWRDGASRSRYYRGTIKFQVEPDLTTRVLKPR